MSDFKIKDFLGELEKSAPDGPYEDDIKLPGLLSENKILGVKVKNITRCLKEIGYTSEPGVYKILGQLEKLVRESYSEYSEEGYIQGTIYTEWIDSKYLCFEFKEFIKNDNGDTVAVYRYIGKSEIEG